MPADNTSRRSRFTIWHGLAASLLLHATPAASYVWSTWAAPTDEPSSLVVELQGAVADAQTEAIVQQEIKGSVAQDKPEPAKPAQTPASEAAEQHPIDDQDAAMPPPAPQPTEQKPEPQADTKSAGTSDDTIAGAQEGQVAHTVQPDRKAEIALRREYGARLSKRVQAHLVYPDDARKAKLQGTAKVSFVVLPSGDIRPETLKIVTSSGQPLLDTSALKTIRASVPFDPAPAEMPIAIAVEFGRQR